MAFKMGVSTEALEGKMPVPNGIYEVQLSGFEPKVSKNGDSINLNPILKIVNHPQHNGQRIFFNLNTKAPWIMQDLAHAFGFPMEEHPTGDGGAMEAHLPGGPNAWQGNPDDISTMKYQGPMLGQVAKVEVIEEHKPNQRPRNNIKMFICAIPDCSTKYPKVTHSTNLIK